ncbi:ABC transporter permease [Filomicrobium sp.]|uniref:ABC transporter permease n=1 Tax=Filomicrobium sp. TaxID=2024831 RepID=UPI002585F532|nr:ABC transporter permease [Filomicrobium sp.]MCV0370859.1 ABC transporter permease [Filomicrobium sp.]
MIAMNSMLCSVAGRFSQELVVAGLAVALALVFAAAIPGFATWGNAMALLRSIAIIGVLALGMSVVIIGGGIDLSQIAVALVSAGVAAIMINGGFPVSIALLVGLFAAIGMGLANGWFVAYLGIPSLFATLASALLFMGAARSTLMPSTIINLPPGDGAFLVLGTNWAGVPVPALIFAVSAVVMHLFLAHLVVGRFVYAVGDNPATARLSGLPVRRLRMMTFVMAAVIGYLGGLVMVASTAMVDLGTAKSTFIFDVVLVAVAGGVSLSGARGGVASVLAGTAFVGVLLNGMSILDVNSQVQTVIKGSLLLAAIVLDSQLRPHDEEAERHSI